MHCRDEGIVGTAAWIGGGLLLLKSIQPKKKARPQPIGCNLMNQAVT